MDPLVVRVVSRRPPRIAWRCSTCSRRTEFDNTEKFRANANRKLIDIWLIYSCSRCGERKKLTVVERTAVSRLSGGLLQAAQDNDPALARALGRDLGLMRRNRIEVASGDEWALQDLRAGTLQLGGEVRLSFEEPLLVRLDQVVAAVFGLGRRDRRTLPAFEVSPAGRVDRLRLWADAAVGVPQRSSVNSGPLAGPTRPVADRIITPAASVSPRDRAFTLIRDSVWWWR